MEFNPNSKAIQLCIQGMNLEQEGRLEEAGKIFLSAWNEASNDLEKFNAAYFVARTQKIVHEKLQWYEKALHLAQGINNAAVKGALPNLYTNIAKCYEELDNAVNAKKNHEQAFLSRGNPPDPGPFYHGTRADLKIGDLLTPGLRSNYKPELTMNHVYFTALVNGAGLAAALAKGEGGERVYIVEPTGIFENDPNVTDKKFPGNPTRSYRTQQPLKIVGEVTEWERQSPEQISKWREKLDNVRGDIIN